MTVNIDTGRATFAVSSTELALLCALLNVSPPLAMRTDPLAGMSEAEMSEVWDNACNTLAERGLAERVTSTELDITETLATAISSASQPTAIVALSKPQSDTALQTTFVYLTERVAVWHVVLDGEQHRFGTDSPSEMRTLLRGELLLWANDADEFTPLLVPADELSSVVKVSEELRLDAIVAVGHDTLDLSVVLVKSDIGQTFLLTGSVGDPTETVRVCAATRANIDEALKALLMGTPLDCVESNAPE